MFTPFIKVDIPRGLHDLTQGRQIPFVTAKALTITAKDTQAEEKRHIKDRFINRNQWTVQGVRITPATKKTLAAKVYLNRWYMTPHEDGGKKKPRSHKYLAVPSANVRRSKRGKIQPGQRPNRIAKTKTAFFAPTKTGRMGLWQRTGKDTRRLMYTLVPVAQIKDRLDFRETADRVVKARFFLNFSRAMDHAIRTAR